MSYQRRFSLVSFCFSISCKEDTHELTEGRNGSLFFGVGGLLQMTSSGTTLTIHELVHS